MFKSQDSMQGVWVQDSLCYVPEAILIQVSNANWCGSRSDLYQLYNCTSTVLIYMKGSQRKLWDSASIQTELSGCGDCGSICTHWPVLFQVDTESNPRWGWFGSGTETRVPRALGWWGQKMPYNGFSNYCLEWYPRTQGESHHLAVNIKYTSHLHLRISSASLAVPPPETETLIC